jgi:hypothetical protein
MPVYNLENKWLTIFINKYTLVKTCLIIFTCTSVKHKDFKI